MKFISIITIICITLFGLFGLFAIFTKQGNRKANKILGVFFLLWAFDFLDGMLLLEGFYLEHPNFALWNESFVFLYGPLLYFYTLHIARIKTPFKWRFLLHLIPFIISLTIAMFFFHTLSREHKLEVLSRIIELKQPSETYVFIGVIYLHFFSYIYLSKKHIRKTVKNLNNFYSNHNLAWLNILLNFFLVILTISVLTSVLQFNRSKLYFEIGLPILTIIMGLFVASVIWNALNRPFNTLNDDTTVKYSALRLDPEEKEVILKKITNALKKDRLYLNPESQVINDTLDKSFFDLINTYRIEAAKETFKKNKDPKLTVLEVMYDVGFNSKSSFNTQFKKRTGLTPSEYMKLN